MTPGNENIENDFNRSIMIALAIVGMAIGIALPMFAYIQLQGIFPEISDPGDRLAFAIKWMCFPVLALVAGMGAIGAGRIFSEYADGSTPPVGTRLELHRRYMQNTVEQLLIFIPTQLALVTLLPADRLAVIPVWAVLFLVARILFWAGYIKNPMYRSLGIMMVVPNQFAALFILFQIVM
ncbi:MAPEG family protein [Sphingorhabdus sp. Alg231-15]|uniref:MAPEG family protein n=1 Tax=Sphingorhabdus sp. Alg231-15 TaxID=1922222 RepID=UPI000D55979D